MNNEVDDILYFEDHAVFSLNAAQMLFPALIITITISSNVIGA